MTDIRTRLIDALRVHLLVCGVDPAELSQATVHLVDALLSLPGIAIVEVPQGVSESLKLTQFWAVGYGDGQIDGEVTYAHLDSARNALDEALESYPDAYLATFWATGYIAATVQAQKEQQ